MPDEKSDNVTLYDETEKIGADFYNVARNFGTFNGKPYDSLKITKLSKKDNVPAVSIKLNDKLIEMVAQARKVDPNSKQ